MPLSSSPDDLIYLKNWPATLQTTIQTPKNDHKLDCSHPNYSAFFFTLSCAVDFVPAKALLNSPSTNRTALPPIRRACSTYSIVVSRDGSTYVTNASTTSPRAKHSNSAAHCAHRRRWTRSDVDCCASMLEEDGVVVLGLAGAGAEVVILVLS